MKKVKSAPTTPATAGKGKKKFEDEDIPAPKSAKKNGTPVSRKPIPEPQSDEEEDEEVDEDEEIDEDEEEGFNLFIPV